MDTTQLNSDTVRCPAAPRMLGTTLARSATAMAVTVVAACGGGGGTGFGDDGPSLGTNFVDWTDNANGTVIVDADNEEFRVDADSRRVADRTGTQASALTVDASSRVLDRGQPVGTVQLVAGSNGRRVAAFRCTDGSAMNITFRVDSTYGYTCGGGSGSSGGTGGTGAGSGTDTRYVSFSNNDNGTVVLDSDNERFQVDATSRLVVDRSGTRLNGLTVDAGAVLAWNGTPIGAVTGTAGAGGGSVAAFFCTNGSRLDLTVSVSSWTYACASGSSGSSGSTGSGGSGNSGGAQTRTFITWIGSANGEFVVDASGDTFKFNQATRCLYSQNRDVEYRNFCLSTENTVVFGGSLYRISRIVSTANTCIVGLTTSSGNYADIVTGGDRIDTISDSGRRPTPC